MCTVLLPPHVNPTTVNKYIKYSPNPKIFLDFYLNYNMGLHIISCTILTTSHHLGPNSFNPVDGSNTFIQKTSIKLQHMVSKFGTLQFESPQTVRIQVFWHMMLCWWVSGFWHCIPSKWQEPHTQQCSVIPKQTQMFWNNVWQPQILFIYR